MVGEVPEGAGKNECLPIRIAGALGERDDPIDMGGAGVGADTREGSVGVGAGPSGSRVGDVLRAKPINIPAPTAIPRTASATKRSVFTIQAASTETRV